MPTPTPAPTTMKAWQYTATHGGIEKNLKLNLVPTPAPKPTQNLVRVSAVALNPVDYKPGEHPLLGRLLIKKPATPGLDIVGTIVTPAQNSSFKAGQRVFGIAGATPFDDGGLRQFCTTETRATVEIPDGMEDEGKGTVTIGVAGLTAYQSIIPHVKRGDRVFINGGSGGTGVFGIQIAKAIGCTVTTTCSGRNVELCKSLGADDVVDYTKGDVVEELKKIGEGGFNHVVDNAGADPDLYWRCHEYAAKDAKYVMVAGEPSLASILLNIRMRLLPGFLGGGQRKILGFFPKASHEDLQQIGMWMKEGKVKPVVDETFKFEDAPEAFKKLKTGRARGKIVVDVAPME